MKENDAEEFEEAVLEDFLKLMKDIKYRFKKLNKHQREFLKREKHIGMLK